MPDALIAIALAIGGVSLLILVLVAGVAIRFYLVELPRARRNRRPGYVELARPPFDDELERRRRRHDQEGDHVA